MVFYEFCGIVACRKNILVYYIIRTLFNIPPVKISNGVIEKSIVKGTNIYRVAITIYAVPFTRRWFVRSALKIYSARKVINLGVFHSNRDQHQKIRYTLNNPPWTINDSQTSHSRPPEPNTTYHK